MIPYRTENIDFFVLMNSATKLTNYVNAIRILPPVSLEGCRWRWDDGGFDAEGIFRWVVDLYRSLKEGLYTS